MPYVCYECGNKHRFREEGTEHGRADYTCNTTRIVDADGCCDDVDTDNYEYEYHDDIGFEIEERMCDECGSADIHSIDEDDWDRWAGSLSVTHQVGFSAGRERFILEPNTPVKSVKVKAKVKISEGKFTIWK